MTTNPSKLRCKRCVEIYRYDANLANYIHAKATTDPIDTPEQILNDAWLAGYDYATLAEGLAELRKANAKDRETKAEALAALERYYHSQTEKVLREVVGDNLTLKEYAPSHVPTPDIETAIKVEGKNRHNELLDEQRQRAANLGYQLKEEK